MFGCDTNIFIRRINCQLVGSASYKRAINCKFSSCSYTCSCACKGASSVSSAKRRDRRLRNMHVILWDLSAAASTQSQPSTITRSTWETGSRSALANWRPRKDTLSRIAWSSQRDTMPHSVSTPRGELMTVVDALTSGK